MSNLVQRAITGAVFVAVMLGAILFHPFTFIGLFLLITILGLLEFFRIAQAGGMKSRDITGLLSGMVLFLSVALSAKFKDISFIALNIVSWFLIFVSELYYKSEKPFSNISYTLLGILYVAFPLTIINLIVFPFFLDWKFTPEILLGCLFIQWASDTGAYLVGRMIGKRKLFERISPGKSWEGSFGGTLAAIFVAYFISGYYMQISRTDWIVISIIIVIAGTYGDLVESMLKRSLNIKDSGNILPGHGGILDRFDALLLSAPMVFVYLVLSHTNF